MEVFVKYHVPGLNSCVSTRIIGSKELTKKLLSSKNIPVPRGFEEKNTKRALARIKFESLNYPLVVKPVSGTQGAAVSVDIREEANFKLAVADVFRYNRRCKGRPNSFLVEEYVPGNDYRLLVLDNEVIAAVMKKPAYVIGDGRSSILQLIEIYNSNPGVEKDQPLCPIVVDRELGRILFQYNLKLSSVVRNGKKVILRKNANVSTGGRSFECLKKTNPQYIELALQVAKLFQLRFCSVDFIAPDISKFEKFVVLEMDDAPGFDIHEVPYRGKPTPVSWYIVRALFRKPPNHDLPLTSKNSFAKLSVTC